MNRKDKTYLEIINSVSKIINEDVNVLNSKSKINDFVNWDSISHVNILLKISKNFKIEIPGSEYQNLLSIEQIYNYILKKK